MKKVQFLGCLLLLLGWRSFGQWPSDTPVAHDLFRLKHSPSDADRAKASLRLGTHYLYKPGEERTDLDSALWLTRQAHDLFTQLNDTTNTANATLVLGFIYSEMKEFSKARQLLPSLADSNKMYLLRSMIGYRMTLPGSNSQDFDTAVSYTRQALAISASCRTPWDTDVYRGQLIDNFDDGGQFNYNRGNKELKEKELRYGVWLDHQGPSVSIRAYWTLAMILALDGGYEEALSIALEMKRSVEKKNNPEQNELPYIVLARIYLDIGRPADALENARKAIDLRIKTGTVNHFNSSGIMFKYLAMALVALRRPREALSIIQSDAPHFFMDDYSKSMIAQSRGDCYAALEEDRKAEQEYLQGIAFAVSIPQNVFRFKLYEPLGALYVKMGQYSKALYYLEALTADSNKLFFPLKDQREVQLLLFKVDSARGEFVSAIRHYKLHKLLNDSIFNDTRNKHEEELKIRYETEKKDDDINLLRQNNKIGAITLHQTRFAKNIFIAGVIILFILLGLLYSRYLLKLRSNRLLQDQRDETNQAYARLEQLLNEKEWLVKEIHHRVKNNLQMIMSLIDVQSYHLEDKHAILALHNLNHRMRAIALIHQRLYQTEGMTLVNMKSYIPELVSYFNEEMHQGNGFNVLPRVRFELYVEDIQLDVSQSVAIGLILNEVVTNSVKHAFEGRETGLISIRMTEEGENIHLTVADNGRGLVNASGIDKNKSMGFQLISRLTGQLKALLTVENRDGLITTIKFRKELRPDQVSMQG